MKKRFDCVSFQRKVRDEIGKKLLKNPKSFTKALHDRFAYLRRTKTTASN